MFKGKYFKKSMKKVSSLEDYISHIDYAVKNIFGTNSIWFRGHADTDYKLVPNILRNNQYSIETEEKVNGEFINKAKGFINNFSDFEDDERYYLMQHYGLKTRLLDWTEGYLIALFFSLKLSSMDNRFKDPCVWIINPIELNKMSVSLDKVIDVKVEKEIQKKYFEGGSNSLEPIAISSTYSNQRILRQKGCFTLHKNKKDLMSTYRRNSSNALVKIIIARNKANLINEQLKLAGISESSIFPDLEGLSRELNMKYRL